MSVEKIDGNPFTTESKPMQSGCLSHFVSNHAVKRTSSNFHVQQLPQKLEAPDWIDVSHFLGVQVSYSYPVSVCFLKGQDTNQ